MKKITALFLAILLVFSAISFGISISAAPVVVPADTEGYETVTLTGDDLVFGDFNRCSANGQNIIGTQTSSWVFLYFSVQLPKADYITDLEITFTNNSAVKVRFDPIETSLNFEDGTSITGDGGAFVDSSKITVDVAGTKTASLKMTDNVTDKKVSKIKFNYDTPNKVTDGSNISLTIESVKYTRKVNNDIKYDSTQFTVTAGSNATATGTTITNTGRYPQATINIPTPVIAEKFSFTFEAVDCSFRLQTPKVAFVDEKGVKYNAGIAASGYVTVLEGNSYTVTITPTEEVKNKKIAGIYFEYYEGVVTEYNHTAQITSLEIIGIQPDPDVVLYDFDTIGMNDYSSNIYANNFASKKIATGLGAEGTDALEMEYGPKTSNYWTFIRVSGDFLGDGLSFWLKATGGIGIESFYICYYNAAGSVETLKLSKKPAKSSDGVVFSIEYADYPEITNDILKNIAGFQIVFKVTASASEGAVYLDNVKVLNKTFTNKEYDSTQFTVTAGSNATATGTTITNTGRYPQATINIPTPVIAEKFSFTFEAVDCSFRLQTPKVAFVDEKGVKYNAGLAASGYVTVLEGNSYTVTITPTEEVKNKKIAGIYFEYYEGVVSEYNHTAQITSLKVERIIDEDLLKIANKSQNPFTYEEACSEIASLSAAEKIAIANYAYNDDYVPQITSAEILTTEDETTNGKLAFNVTNPETVISATVSDAGYAVKEIGVALSTDENTLATVNDYAEKINYSGINFSEYVNYKAVLISGTDYSNTVLYARPYIIYTDGESEIVYYGDVLSHKGAPTKKIGDANGDGVIDVRDLVRLKKIVAEIDVEFDFIGADCNADGEINSLDLTALRVYLLTDSGLASEPYDGEFVVEGTWDSLEDDETDYVDPA